MVLQQSKQEEIKYHLDSSNDQLAFRMLIDLVLDTENIPSFKQCISLTEWMELNPEDKIGLREKIVQVLDKLVLKNISSANENESIISMQQVLKKYTRNKFILGPIDLEIKTGHLIGLVGENGNGKTTLLRMLAKELSLTEGEIDYHFAPHQDDYTLRTKLIYIPQRTPKWFGKVKDNLQFTATSYGISATDNEYWVYMLMIRFGLWKFRNHSWNELSSGYKMRFELARTFLRKPRLLLLDEPLANLDILSQQLILEDIKMLGKSAQHPLAIVLSSQQLYEVEKVSDEVIFLRDGKASSFNQLKNQQVNHGQNLVVELEIENNKEALLKALSFCTIKEIKLLGSNYYLELQSIDSVSLLQHLSNQGIVIKYFRDISYSTRRFFNQ